MTLQAHELLETYHHLYRIFPGDLHIGRPLIQVFEKRGEYEKAYQLAMALGRRMLASGRTSVAAAALRLCQRIKPETDEDVESMLAMAEVMSDAPCHGTDKVFSLIEKLSDQEALEFIREANFVTSAKNEVLIREEEVGRSFYLILQGAMAVHIHVSDGSDRKIKVLRDGDYFGEHACVYQLPRTATVIADEETLLLEFSDAAIARLMEKSPDAGAILMDVIQQRLIQSMTHVHPAFADIVEGDHGWVSEESRIIDVPVGEVVVCNPVAECYVVLHGQLTVMTDTQEVEKTLQRKDMFSMLDKHLSLPVGAKVVADERSLICCMPTGIFHAFMRAYGSFEQWVEAQGR